MLLGILFAVPAADAFCGTYVSSYEAPKNSFSEVAIVRQGTRTTLTMSNDVVGDTSDFAMVVPVPEVLAEDQIHVVDPEVFTRLRDYSNPREVSYTCEDFEVSRDTGWDFDAGGGVPDSDTGETDVEVVAQYVVGEYDIQILSATESGALVTWLQANGYQVPDASRAMLGEYIASGAFFFAAQVRGDAGIESGDRLSPLQLTYTADTMMLPVRLGTLNSDGSQDLIIYAFTDFDKGAVGVANYTEVTFDHDCMWLQEADETFSQYYARQLESAFTGFTEAYWLTEYSWGNGNCDPCTGVVPTPSDVYTLGYQDDPHYGQYYWFTRIRTQYTPYTATQDLVLYESNITQQMQMRFIQYNAELEDRFPVCGEGMRADPGTCPDDGTSDTDGSDTDGDWVDGDGTPGCGGGGSCGTGVGPGLALVVAGLAAARRRRA